MKKEIAANDTQMMSLVPIEISESKTKTLNELHETRSKSANFPVKACAIFTPLAMLPTCSGLLLSTIDPLFHILTATGFVIAASPIYWNLKIMKKNSEEEKRLGHKLEAFDSARKLAYHEDLGDIVDLIGGRMIACERNPLENRGEWCRLDLETTDGRVVYEVMVSEDDSIATRKVTDNLALNMSMQSAN